MAIIRDENKWIDLARSGDADAFCQLYGLYRSRLYRYAFYRLRSETDVEDAVSECVLSAWRQIGTLRSSEAFGVWIFRILSGCCGKLIRQQIDRQQQLSLDDPASAEPPGDPADGDSSADTADTRMILEEALAELTEEERNIVLLSAVCGFKSHEIAELTGRTAGSVRSVLSRSLKKVRGYLS